MQAWRHDIHRHPELAFEEQRTAARVAELLQEFGLEVHTGSRQHRRRRGAEEGQ